jgi:hypothetical protein
VDKVAPLLDAQQQQKLEGVRDDLRRRLVEKMAGQAVDNVEADVKNAEGVVKKKLEALD